MPKNATDDSKGAVDMIKNFVMRVDGMKGTQCEHKVKSALGMMDGVQGVAVDVPGKTVAVSLDPSCVSEQQITNTVVQQGYRLI
jgi:copper chaperone